MKMLKYISAALLIAFVSRARAPYGAGRAVDENIAQGRVAISASPTEIGQGSASPSEACPAPSFSVRRMRVTAYCPGPCCTGPFADGITASGVPLYPCTASGTGYRMVQGRPVTANGGLIAAADPSIPFGTVIDIPGYGRAVVLDRGGAIKGNKLDVLFSSHQAALEWGVQYLNVRLMPPVYGLTTRKF